MAATTPVYGFPYQELGDAPDGAGLGEDGFLAVESKFVTVDSAIAAITGVTPTVGSSTTNVSTSSTTFVPGSTAFGVAFTAPASGSVWVTMTAYMQQTQDGGVALVSHTMRTGATIGSGTVVGTAANSNRALVIGGTVDAGQPQYFQASRRTLWTGLTPGASYNARVEMAVDNGGGVNVFYRELQIDPSI